MDAAPGRATHTPRERRRHDGRACQPHLNLLRKLMTFVLGIDIGHSVVKLAHGEDTEGQPARAMILPATACRADEGAPIRTHRNPHGDGPCAVLIDGNTWIAGAPWRSLRLPRPPRQL